MEKVKIDEIELVLSHEDQLEREWIGHDKAPCRDIRHLQGVPGRKGWNLPAAHIETVRRG